MDDHAFGVQEVTGSNPGGPLILKVSESDEKYHVQLGLMKMNFPKQLEQTPLM